MYSPPSSLADEKGSARLKFLPNKNLGGFTLIELVIALAGGLLIFLSLLNIFSLSRVALTKGGDLSEIVQNGRIGLERISRELRQADELVTAIPDSPTSPAQEIEFLDGHALSERNYIRYYLQAGALRRELSFYHLASNPTVRVNHRDRDIDGSPAIKTATDDQIIAEYASSFLLWGSPLINVELTLLQNTTTTTLTTTLYARNLP